jgi:hypothetical protein
MKRIRAFAFTAVFTLALGLAAQETKPSPAAAQPAPAANEEFQSAEGVVRALYGLVSVKPGGPQTDWEKVRSLFYKDAVIFLRTAPQTTEAFSVQGFIDDFVAFNQRARVAERGFTEKIVRLKPMVFQDIAHVLVLYEASIPASPRPPQQGVDSFQLMRKNGRWWIFSVANDVPAPGAMLPQALRE